ncbi:scaffold protein NifU [Pelomyxa schiedti]|nr:scaffold protein NifU [Pelomyxa schiedti]
MRGREREGGGDALVGGSLWSQYSDKVLRRMEAPAHRGAITEDHATAIGCHLVVASYGAEACGDKVVLYWAVDNKTNVIKDAKFQTFGCGTAIASSDAAAELCVGKTPEEALKITNLTVENYLRDSPDKPAIPPQKMHCSVMAHDVIKRAVASANGASVNSLEDEDIVCECARVSLNSIKDAIRLNNLKTVEEITQFTKAGGYCKSCIAPGGHDKRKIYLVDILKSMREEEPDSTPPLQPPHHDSSSAMHSTTFPPSLMQIPSNQREATLSSVLTEKVLPTLAADGGSVGITGVELVQPAADETTTNPESKPMWKVFVQYTGACCGCPSATTNTLMFIEKALQDNFPHDHIIVQTSS